MKGRGSSGISYISGGLKINTKSTCLEHKLSFSFQNFLLYICELEEKKKIQKHFDF